MNDELFKKEARKKIKLENRRRHLEEGSGIYALKSILYSKTKKIIPRKRRSIKPPIQKVSDNWQKHNDIDIKKNYASLMKDITKKDRIHFLIFHRISNFLITLGILFAVFSVLYAGYSIFYASETINPDNIDIFITAPKSVASGDIFQMQVEISNKNNKALELASLVIHYPDGTKSPGNSKTDLTIQRIQLGKIQARQKKKGTVRAVLFAPQDSMQKIKVELEYRPEGKNYITSVMSYHTVRINSNAIDVNVVMDKELIDKQDVLATINIYSNAKVQMNDLALKVRYPFGFKPKAFSENPTEGNNIWLIKTLSPGEKKQINIHGKIVGQDLDEKTFSFEIGFYNQNQDEIVIEPVIARATQTVLIKKPFISMDVKINADESEGFYVINPGETKNVEISWVNNLDERLENVIFAAAVYGNAVDPYSITSGNGFYDSSNNVIIWNKQTTKNALAEVVAKQKGKLKFKIAAREAADLLDVKEPTINISLNVAGQRLAKDKVREMLESVKDTEIRINSKVNLESRLLYSGNPFASDGPLPPRVNQKTTYAVRWKLQNTTNKLSKVKVTAELPVYVKYLNLVTPASENVVYNKINNTITWHVGNVEPKTGYGDVDVKEVTFAISFVPSASQLGKVPDLLINQKVEAYDEFTKQTITKEFDNLSSELQESNVPANAGRVIK